MLSALMSLAARRKERRRLKKFEAVQSWSRGLGLQETFEGIYREGKWGQPPDAATPFWSGNGSKPDYTAPYEAFVVDFLKRHTELTSIVDIGCGDFQVSKRILSRLDRPAQYTGCDIVRPMIAHHQQVHAAPGTNFAVVNAVQEDPPAGDAVVIRQILQHLSNAHIARILERAQRLFRVALISESLPVPAGVPNLDIGPGIATRIALKSGVYIDKAPYGLKVAESFDVAHGPNELIRTSVVWFKP
jgi:SAM-dependent methyltransferase